MQDTIKTANILVTGFPEEKKTTGAEKYLEKVISENFPKLLKYIIFQIQELETHKQNK